MDKGVGGRGNVSGQKINGITTNKNMTEYFIKGFPWAKAGNTSLFL